MISKKVIPFIEKHKDLIEEENFDALYSAVEETEIDSAALTEAFLEADINPMIYFHDTIPYAYAARLPLTTINIPDGILSAGTCAFQYSALKSIELPSISSVFHSTFKGCTNLVEVKFGDKISSIEQSAFKDCTSLTKIDLPKELEILRSYAFAGCTNLQVVTIPQTLRDTRISVFEDCPSLEKIVYEGTMQQWKAIGTATIFDYDKLPFITIDCTDGKLRYQIKDFSWVQI